MCRKVAFAIGEAFDAACKELHDGHPDDVRNVMAPSRRGTRDSGSTPGCNEIDRQEMIFPFTTRGRPTPSVTAFRAKAAAPAVRSRVRS